MRSHLQPLAGRRGAAELLVYRSFRFRARIQGAVEAFSSSPKSLVEPVFQDLSGRQLCQVLGDSNAAALELKQFDVLVGLAGTEMRPRGDPSPG